MLEFSGLGQAVVGSDLLRRLSAGDYALLQPHFVRVPLRVGEQLAMADRAITAVYFPEAGVIGLLDVLVGGRKLAVGLVGHEGLVGWPIVLGNDRWPHDAIVRAENASAIKVDAPAMMEALEQRPAIRGLLLRYTSSFVAQMSRTAASNLIHPVEARTARLILLYHDRVGGDEVLLTHEELGLMLGVRRSSITDALHLLEGRGAIRGQRGRVMIRDRSQLEALVADTYGYAEQEYRRLVHSTP